MKFFIILSPRGEIENLIFCLPGDTKNRGLDDFRNGTIDEIMASLVSRNLTL